MRKRHRLAIMSICLGGIVGVLLAFLLASNVATTRASRVRDTVGTPDLIINVGAGDETVLANEVISYVLAYTNTLGQSLENVIITSTLSKQQHYTPVTYLSDPPIAPTTKFTYSGNFDVGYTLEWHLDTLDPGEGGWIVVTTTLPLAAEPPWDDKDKWPLLGMSAVITTSTPAVDAGDGDDASVMVVGPVLKISKDDDPDEIRPGKLLTYTLTVENKERVDAITAHGLVISDALPGNTIFYASDTGTYSPTSPTSGIIIWRPPDPLERDSTTEVNFTVRLTESVCPPDEIVNGKEDYSVRANETIQTIYGSKRRKTDVDDVLEKTIETPDPPSGDNKVFPGGIVTYTVSIYNPRHDQLIAGLRLTDTLPGEPNLFTFLDMLDGGPTPVITSPQVVWDDLDVSAGGVTTFSFRAWVPYHIDIGSKSKTYENNLSASSPDPELDICDMHDQNPSKAKVIRQIELEKSVEPDHVQSGELVTYTITLDNKGDNQIDDIRLTDTLPSGFSYVRMLDWREPEAGYQHNPVVWDDVSVPPGDEALSFSFQVRASGAPVCYENYLSASSPWTTIPDESGARVCIDPPLIITKTVEPDETFVETMVHYDVWVCNVSTETYTIDRFKDHLCDGLYSDGANTYEHTISPPEDLEPGECWEHGFDVDVTYDVGCGNLSKTCRNSAEAHIPSVDMWVAESKLAPLDINPHVTIEKDRDHTAVLPGETFVYTVTLINASSIQIDDVTIVDTLPGDESVYFEYEEMVAGDAPDDYTDHTLEWRDQTIPADGQLVLVYRVRVPQNMPLSGWGQYKNEAEATTTDLVCIESPADVRVKVVDEIIELSKEVDPDESCPLGIVEYDIRLKNRDSVPISGVIVTDTLPCGLGQKCFEFAAMTSGDPEPSEIKGRQVIWRDLTVPGDDTFHLRFNAQTVVLFGDYRNDVSAWCPRSQEITPEEEGDVKPSVTVLPSVILNKNSSPTTTMAGGLVEYTIELVNETSEAFENIRITDTLPAGFSYRRTLEGPSPDQTSPVEVWELSRLGRGESTEIVFEALVGSGVVSGTYINTVNGHCHPCPIPGADAPVQIISGEIRRVYLPLVLRNYEP